MTRRTPFVPALVGSAVLALALAGCSGASSPGATDTGDADTGDGKVRVVASTNVYGDVAAAVGGDLIDVSAIITSTSQDPHEYEATAADQLTISEADLVVENGGGYDAFIDSMIDATDTDASIITAVEFSPAWEDAEGRTGDPTDETTEDADGHDHDHVEGFNEHVWYDPHTIEHVAEAIAEELGALDPDNAATYEANAATFADGVSGLEASLDEIAAAHSGQKVFVTEPVPLYLTQAAGLENATPDAFSEAVEEGQDVPPATLLAALTILEGGEVSAVIVNAQTGGAETAQVVDAAKAADLPVLDFTELVPEGQTYLTWMASNIADLAGSLTR